MESLQDIWKVVLAQLARQLTPVAIKTWLEDCIPIELDLSGCTLVLRTSGELKKTVLSTRFAPMISKVLCDMFFLDDFEVLVLNEREQIPKPAEPKTNDRYTFENFIVGSSNKFAHAAAVSVAENPGKHYNPLFIYGNSGLGKTHLLKAIWHAVEEQFPEMKIVFTKGDDFMNEMVESIKGGTAAEFRLRYRNVGLFLVDDIQFIAGKQSTQVEFFHTFNSIHEQGNQIVITSDRPPIEMSLLDDRLRTRFEGGLMADIGVPDLETRIAIIRNKANYLEVNLNDEAVNLIASKIKTDIRKLEGVNNKISAFMSIQDRPLTIMEINKIIDDFIKPEIITTELIIRETAKYFQLRPEDLRSENRSKNHAIARQIAMYEMQIIKKMSLQDIEKELGRNHTTALSSIRKINKLIVSDKDLARAIQDIESNIKNSVG